MKLVTEFFPSQDESYSGEEVQYRIADTLQTIAERLAQKYGPQPASTEPGYREVPITTDQGDQWSSQLSHNQLKRSHDSCGIVNSDPEKFDVPTCRKKLLRFY